MKKRNFLLTLLAAALTISMCGCKNVDGAAPPANSGVTGEQMSNTAVINTDIGENSEFPSKCRIYKSSSVQFTDEQLFDFFNAYPECGTPQKSEYYTDEYHRYEANGCLGHINRGNNFFFRTDKGDLYESVHYYLAELDGGDPNISYISAEVDLDFAARDEVLKNVQTELSERFGIMPDEWYAFEFDAVKKEGVEFYKQKAYRDAYEPEKIYEGDDLEKQKQQYKRIKDLPADDFYYIDIKYKVDDIPIYYRGVLNIGGVQSGRYVSGTMSQLVYGRNGIEYIIISPAYETDTSNYTEAELIPVDQARGLIQKKYDDIITDNQIEVFDMKLLYLPIPQNDLGKYGKSYELRPHYVFYAKETEIFDGKTFTYNVNTYFDAVTGDELATERLTEDGGMVAIS